VGDEKERAFSASSFDRHSFDWWLEWVPLMIEVEVDE
jgi:hypothetical protein